MMRVAIIAVCVLGLAAVAVSQSDLNEANALIIIKQSAGAPAMLASWNGTDPCGDSWLGVQCTPASGNATRYVTGLQLPGFGLTGTLSPALGLLVNLQILDLSQNELEGAIPREFQNLTQMEQLDLHDNHLVTTLDPWIGYMPLLVSMYIGQNSIWGLLPDALFRLTSLQRLSLGTGLMTGSVPSTVAGLTNLQLLDLSANYLSGQLPTELGQLSQLQGLLLDNNSFTGNIPNSLGNLSNLTYLYLQNNQFTGSIPAQLAGKPDIVARYDGNPLCQNSSNTALCAFSTRLTAVPVPASSLVQLAPTAPVSISTSAPGIVAVPGDNSSIVSTPGVAGETPLTGTCMPGTQQTCTCGNGVTGQGVCANTGLLIVGCTCGSKSSGGGRRWSTAAIVLVSVLPAVFVLVLLCVIAAFAVAFLRQRRRMEALSEDVKKHDLERGVDKQTPLGSVKDGSVDARPQSPPGSARNIGEVSPPRSSIAGSLRNVAGAFIPPAAIRTARSPSNKSDEDRKSSSPPSTWGGKMYRPGDPPLVFSAADLKFATDTFSTTQLLGASGFGRVYAGRIDGQDIVVKRLNELQGLRRSSETPMRDHFQAEIDFLSRLDHPNLMHLIGYCNESRERCLVYPYMPNRSLFERLHDTTHRQPLEWQQRLSIAAQSASALAYLHQNELIHRDFRTSNVLLDQDMQAVVSDFGIAKLSAEDGMDAQEVTSALIRQSGYMAPEYDQGEVTEKSDVYSFGVVLLELMTGRPAVLKDGTGLVQWAVEYMHKDPEYMEEIIDPRLEGSWPSIPFFWTVELAGACIDSDPAARPDMVDVARAINFVLQHATGAPYMAGSLTGSLDISQVASLRSTPGHSRHSSGGSVLELSKEWDEQSRRSSLDEGATPRGTPYGGGTPTLERTLSRSSLLDSQ